MDSDVIIRNVTASLAFEGLDLNADEQDVIKRFLDKKITLEQAKTLLLADIA
jgi:hypothetical protein